MIASQFFPQSNLGDVLVLRSTYFEHDFGFVLREPLLSVRYGRPIGTAQRQWRVSGAATNDAALADESNSTLVFARSPSLTRPRTKLRGPAEIERRHASRTDVYKCTWLDLTGMSSPQMSLNIAAPARGRLRATLHQGDPRTGGTQLGQIHLVSPAAGTYSTSVSGITDGTNLWFRLRGENFMAITTYDGALAGMLPPRDFCKAATPTLVAGRPHSLFYLAGIPGAATASTAGMAGEALTTYAGQIPFPNPTGGNFAYLSRFQAAATIPGTLLLCDRLWHNSGLNLTSTSAQTINSVTWPARDANGSTDGVEVQIGLEVTTATGSGTPTLTMSYTNSTGASGRSGTNIIATAASSAIGAFYPIGLQGGDLGVRSIQTFTLSATWTSGAASLVAYRVLARLEIPTALAGFALDPLSGGFPRLYDNTVPFLIFIPSTTTASNVFGQVVYSHG